VAHLATPATAAHKLRSDGLSSSFLITLPAKKPEFEAPDIDRGTDQVAFDLDFAIGTLEFAAGEMVSLIDAHHNTTTGETQRETVYAKTIILGASSTLTVDNSKLYYRTLINNGGTIDFENGGSATQASVAPAPQKQSTIDPMAIPPAAYYIDWTVQGAFATNIVHVGDTEICPGRTYLVQEIALGQDVTVESNYSAATKFPTVAKWGDVLGSGAGLASQNTTNFGDALGIIQGFSAAQSVSKAWLDLEPASPNFAAVGFPDVLRCTQAIASQPYPFAGCP